MAVTGARPDPETTLPPARALEGRICPSCYRKLDPGDATGPTSSPRPGMLPRCPEHGLAFIAARDVAAAAGDALLGTTIAGRFTVLARLGSGSMGSVYRARQEAVGRDVALKIVRRDRAYDPETRARFEREARATSALVSPHTVTVFDFGEADDGAWFLAMELLEGETLGQRLKRVQRLPAADAVRVAREALKSLAEAHLLGIVHRDLKPDNLFLVQVPDEGGDRRGEICKVLDFGIAKLLRDEVRVDQLETQAGTVFGTPRFMSPEQAQGIDLDARSDLYSLGVILYQMLAGRPPFVDDDAVVVMARHIKDDPPPFSSAAPDARVPPALERVVRRTLAKRPEDRPASAEALIAELGAALARDADASTGSHAATWSGPDSGAVSAPGGRRRALAIAVAVVAVGALAVTAVTRGFRAAPASPQVGSAALQAGARMPSALTASAAAAAPVDAPAPSASVDADAAAPGKTPIPGRNAAPRSRTTGPDALPLKRQAGDRYGRFE